ncbi:hypothetical protein ACFL3V_07235, partial [Nanoarchaeota archaeon]
TYGQQTVINCTADHAQVTPSLFRDGTGYSIPDTKTLAANTYNYSCNASETQNYTYAFINKTLTISKASTTTTLYLDGSEGNLAVTYGATTNATATTSAGSLALYRNATPVSNSEITALGAGYYNYTAINPGNENYTGSTATWFLTVNTASDNVNLYINGNLNQNLTITYSTQSNATATSTSGTENLYRNGSPVSDPHIGTFAAGLYAYKVNSTGDQNYSANSTGLTYYLTIDKATSTCSLTFDKATPQDYSTQLNASCVCTNPEASAVLWRNSSDVTTAENNKLITLAAGTYGYVCNSSATQNYTSATNSSSFTIDRATTILDMTSSPSWSETYGQQTVINCTADHAQVTPKLYRNATEYSIPDTQTLAANVYNYSCNASETQNYTAAFINKTLTISKASTTTTLYLDGSEDNLTVTYGATTNATATTSAGSLTLYRNATPVSNSEVTVLGAGFYNYTAINPGNENYTGSTATWFLTVNPTSDSVNLYLNGNLNQNITITYGTQSNATATSTSDTELLYRNDSPVSDPHIGTFAAGLYAYKVNSTGDQNYSANSTGLTYYLTIDKAAPTLNLTATPGWTVNNDTQTTVNCTSPTPGVTAELFRNGTKISIPDTQTLAIGYYNYTCSVNETQNYTSLSTTQILQVTQKQIATCSLVLLPSSGQTHPVSVNATCSCTNPESAAMLLRNGSDITSENNTLVSLPAGDYGYVCNASESQNYSYVENTTAYTINKATTTLNLTASPSWSETYGTQTVINCTADNSEVTPALFRNSTPVSIPDTQTLAANTYGYVCNASATQNYTGDSESNTLTIAKASTTTQLYLNGSQDNMTITYGVETNASATTSAGSLTIYRNSSPVSNPEITTLSAGFYQYTATNPGDENYTGSSESWYLTVSKVTSTCSLVFDKSSPQAYSTQLNASCSCTNAEASATLWRNSTDVTSSENNNLITLPAGNWNYICNVSATQNYTGTSDASGFNITKGSTTLNLTSSPSWSETYGTQTTINCTADNSEVTPRLYRDGTEYSITDTNTFAAGNYGYVCNATATQNYTGDSESNTLQIAKASTTTTLYLNGSQDNLTITYGVATNASATTDTGSVTIYRDATPVSNPEIDTLGAGFYNYTAINPGNENYTASSATWFLTINTAPDNVDLYLNGNLNQNITIAYSTQSNATATSTSGTELLYRNGAPVSDPHIGTFPAGVYSYKVNSTGNQNYSANSTGLTYYLTIDKTTTTCSLTLDPSSTITYPAQARATCSCTNAEASAALWRNSTDVTGQNNTF